MKYIPIITLLFLLCSCKYLDMVSKDEMVAKVGNEVLYKSEIQNLIPPGTTPEDSLSMIKQYVNSWALKNLLVQKAEIELSKEDKDVQQELDDYRSALLVFRYEKQFVEQRLDTIIGEEECREYYNNYSANFTQNSSVVKARVIKISKTSPNLEIIKKLYKAQSIEEVEELERICYNSADRYNNFNNGWTEISNVAREIPLDVQSCEKEAWSKSCIETNDSLYNYYVYFIDKVASGQVAPFDYYYPRIREIILSKRKQQLIADLEKNLLKEALESNSLKTEIATSKR